MRLTEFYVRNKIGHTVANADYPQLEQEDEICQGGMSAFHSAV